MQYSQVFSITKYTNLKNMIMKTVFALAALVITQWASAQQERILKDFSALAVGGGIELTLVPSSESRLEIQSGDPKKLKVANDEGGLSLSTEGREKFKLTVYYSGSVKEIALSGGVSLTSKGIMKSDNLEIGISGGVEVKITIDTDRFATAIASGSDMKVTGTTKTMEVAVASGGSFEGENLKSTDSDIIVSSGGSARIFATGNVTANVASGGSLVIYGKPKNVHETKAEGAEIKIVK